MKKLYFSLTNHPLALRFPMLRKMIKFAIVGVTNLIVDFTIFFSLISFDFWKKHYLGANFTAFCVAVIWSFYINKKWTFRNHDKNYSAQYIKFFAVSFIGLLLAELILYIFVDILLLAHIWGKLTAVFLIYFWNFFANHWWTFKKGSEKRL